MWNPFRIVRERFQRAALGGIADAMNMIEPETDDDFMIEVRVRRLPPLPAPAMPELEAPETEPAKARGGKGK